jgi:hypothetical protein
MRHAPGVSASIAEKEFPHESYRNDLMRIAAGRRGHEWHRTIKEQPTRHQPAGYDAPDQQSAADQPAVHHPADPRAGRTRATTTADEPAGHEPADFGAALWQSAD